MGGDSLVQLLQPTLLSHQMLAAHLLQGDEGCHSQCLLVLSQAQQLLCLPRKAHGAQLKKGQGAADVPGCARQRSMPGI